MPARTASQHPDSTHHLFDEQFAAFKSGVEKLIERTTTKPTWFGRSITRTSDMIKAHPIAAIGVAIGIGYGIVRIVRRR